MDLRQSVPSVPKSEKTVSLFPIILVLVLLAGMALSPLAFLSDSDEKLPSVASQVMP